MGAECPFPADFAVLQAMQAGLACAEGGISAHSTQLDHQSAVLRAVLDGVQQLQNAAGTKRPAAIQIRQFSVAEVKEMTWRRCAIRLTYA